MNEKEFILGIDLGTSSLKTVIYTAQMEFVCSVKRSYENKQGEAVRAEHWWNAFLSAMKELRDRVNLAKTVCVSFSGYNAFVGVDADLAPVTPVVFYHTAEPSAYMRRIFDESQRKYIYSRTCTNIYGMGIMAPGIRWMKDHHPEAYAKTASFMCSNGFIAAKLTGNCTIDASRASLSALHDPRGEELNWETDVCRLFEIEEEKLPKICNSWDRIGSITESAEKITGIPAGTVVIAGCMDSLCAALGNGIFSESWMLDIGGSAGGLASVSTAPRAHERLYLSRYALPGRWCNNAPLVASARLFDWFCEQFAPDWKMEDFIAAVDRSERFTKEMLFLPYVGGSRYPYWSMDTKGHFLNINMACNRDDMARAIVEGLGCAYRSILDDLQTIGLKKPERIIAAGGDSRFREWVQTKANYLGIPYYLQDTGEVSSKGAALLGAYHIGTIPDPVEYLSEERKERIIVLPEADTSKYEAHYRVYTQKCEILYGKIYRLSEL